ncbi:TIGR02234 family membrane protein [Rhodococcus sp. G-MC3]|uniref:TIGR02234 family membrane protein n=1 Tax=Rhodococcus sp. G-MC3 TaxID=3046209 RepID=UPI0024B9D995|nr:TIGR02234 family membrane protein [Rhodococcus sp. G-MC3]MDJ0393152.1 TIGR02234 family membrane protein [Rhodococcus sp. G-MC3]
MTSTEPGAQPARRSRASAIAVAFLLIGAVCLWGSSRMTWVHVVSSDGLGEQRSTDLLGSTWAAAGTPLALALVAAVAASFAVRGWASRVVAILVALVAVAAAIPALDALVGDVSVVKAADLSDLPGRAEVVSTQAFALPAALAVVGALLALAAAVVLVRKPTTRKVLSSKYDAPAARRDETARRAKTATERAEANGEGDDLTERMLWDALDAGEDPTDVSGTRKSED